MKKQYNIFAHYFQFYLWDEGMKPDAPTAYTDEDISRMVKAEPFVVVIQPKRNFIVPVEVEITGSAPAIACDEYDHVVEASLDLPSGRLEIHECTGGSIDVIPVTPGTYRVRACFEGLGTIDEDGIEGGDRYSLVLWPAPFAPVEVLKQYEMGVDPDVT